MCIDCTFIGARYAYYVVNTCRDIESALVHLTRRVQVHADVTAFCLTGINLLCAEYSSRVSPTARLTFARKTIAPPGLAGRDKEIDLICRCLQLVADGGDVTNLIGAFTDTHTLQEGINLAAVVGVTYCYTLQAGPKYIAGPGSRPNPGMPMPDIGPGPGCNN